VEAVETAIWLTEVAPQSKSGKQILENLASANEDANPELFRLALKLATGAGKTTVMAMLIAWQTINALCRPGSEKLSQAVRELLAGVSCGHDANALARISDPASRLLGPIVSIILEASA
jgi:type III restriction enzyme